MVFFTLVFREIFRLKFKSFNNNISKEEFLQIKGFIKEKPFKIVQCDKNVGFAIISNELYDKLCLSHLNDSNNFVQLTDNPLEHTQILLLINLTI